MRKAVADFVPFDEAYEATDWSDYRDLPAFDASNRGNAYRIYLEMEAESFPITRSPLRCCGSGSLHAVSGRQAFVYREMEQAYFNE